MISYQEVAIRYIIASSWILQPRGPKSSDSWNDGPGSWVIKDDFFFLGPRYRFYLGLSNKGFGMRQSSLLRHGDRRAVARERLLVVAGGFRQRCRRLGHPRKAEERVTVRACSGCGRESSPSQSGFVMNSAAVFGTKLVFNIAPAERA